VNDCHSLPIVGRRSSPSSSGNLSVPSAHFELLSGAEALSTYQFGTNIAKHTFCRHCGIHAFNVPRSDPYRISVNARCLDGIDAASLKATRFFDGRNWETAMAVRRIPESG
jgi:hypothetical protein